MMTNEELYALCDALRYRVREVPLKSAPAAALPGGCIAVNPERIPSPAAEKEILAHELGHLETGSFPTGSPADLEGRHEERAAAAALRGYCPVSAAFRNGGEAARLLLPARLFDSLNDPRRRSVEEKTGPSAPMWDFVRDGYHIFFDEILP